MNKHLHQVNRREPGKVVYTAFFPGNRCEDDCPGREEEKNAPSRLEETTPIKETQRV